MRDTGDRDRKTEKQTEKHSDRGSPLSNQSSSTTDHEPQQRLSHITTIQISPSQMEKYSLWRLTFNASIHLQRDNILNLTLVIAVLSKPL